MILCLLATGENHPLNRHFALDRFLHGDGLDEYGLGNWPYKQ